MSASEQDGDIEKMPVRDFRNYISKAKNTLAVTNYGRTIGYYIPVHHDPKAEDFAALKKAASNMEAVLTAHGISADDILGDFDRLRKEKK